jgi:hypothetical protein
MIPKHDLLRGLPQKVEDNLRFLGHRSRITPDAGLGVSVKAGQIIVADALERSVLQHKMAICFHFFWLLWW